MPRNIDSNFLIWPFLIWQGGGVDIDIDIEVEIEIEIDT